MEISVKDLTLVYEKGNKVIDKINFTIEDGHLISLLGPSGSGKSTILNMIAGLLSPTEGQIFFGDKDITQDSISDRNIGMVFQNYSLYPNMTVHENIGFPLKIAKTPKEEKEETVLKLAKLTHVEDQLDKRPADLSGGQQQRVALARALAKKPSVLLLDEPLSNLDTKLRTLLREEIVKIQKETKITTIFVTHDQNEAMHISDEIMLLSGGKIQQFDKPNNLYDQPENLFTATFIGDPQINLITDPKRISYFEKLFDKKVKTIGVRPDSFTTIKSKDNFEVPVKFVSFAKHGSEENSVFDLYGQELSGLNIDGIDDSQVGKEIKIYIPKSEIHGFDENDKLIKTNKK